jgi:hypothetical protein
MSQTSSGPRTYGNWRRPRTAGLFGLGTWGTRVMFAGIIVTIIAVMVGGLIPGAIVFTVMALGLLTVSRKDADGRSILTRASGQVGWLRTKQGGANLYRSGPTGRGPWGTNQLPGLAAGSRLYEYEDSYGRPFALIYLPSTGDYTIVIGTEPDGAALVDPEQIDSWVADWGHWLGGLSDEPGMVAASVTVESAPDNGTRLRQEVTMSMDPNAPAFSRQMLYEVLATYPNGSASIRAYVAVTYNAQARMGSRRRTVDEMGRDLAARLPGLTQDLSATGAGAARPLSAGQLCEVIRIAYDPDASELIDNARVAGEDTGLRWPDVGPSGHQANWDSYRHEGAMSVTWQMTEAPRGIVQSNILGKLLAPNSEIDRKRVTMLYRPIDSGTAAAIVDADLRAATAIVTGERSHTRDMTGARAAAATAQEESQGAGLVNFGVIITATVADPARLPDVRATVENLSNTARLRIRVAYGSQDSAFAAGLPLGIVLPKHLRVPIQFREKF